jgi:hypothetical protein
VIPQLLLPMLAALGVNAYISAPDKKALWPAFKKGMIAVAAVFVVILAIYFTADYMPGRDTELLKQVKASGQMQLATIFQSFFDGLVADRKSLFGADLLRFLLYFLFTAGTLFLLVRNIIKPLIAVVLLTVFVFVDLISVDVKYLSKSDYEDKEDNEAVFTATNFDNQILADTSYYRVANLSGGAFTENFTSYHFNSIGGYHPAKLSLYNDIAMHKLPREQQAVITALQTRPDSIGYVRTPILNMLNAKYFIFKQGVQTVGAWPNANAYGPAWFVQSIRYVNNADAEMAALDSIDTRTTAVVQDAFKSSIPFEPQPDSAATIRLVKNDNDVVTYTSESATNQFAVFSEVYYKAGWKAFIDGKEAPIVKANYVLRALAVPAGKHSIEFKFEPKGYYNGRKLTGIFNILLFVLVLMAVFMEWRASKKQVA